MASHQVWLTLPVTVPQWNTISAATQWLVSNMEQSVAYLQCWVMCAAKHGNGSGNIFKIITQTSLIQLNENETWWMLCQTAHCTMSASSSAMTGYNNNNIIVIALYWLVVRNAVIFIAFHRLVCWVLWSTLESIVLLLTCLKFSVFLAGVGRVYNNNNNNNTLIYIAPACRMTSEALGVGRVFSRGWTCV